MFVYPVLYIVVFTVDISAIIVHCIFNKEVIFVVCFSMFPLRVLPLSTDTTMIYSLLKLISLDSSVESELSELVELVCDRFLTILNDRTRNNGVKNVL